MKRENRESKITEGEKQKLVVQVDKWLAEMSPSVLATLKHEE